MSVLFEQQRGRLREKLQDRNFNRHGKTPPKSTRKSEEKFKKGKGSDSDRVKKINSAKSDAAAQENDTKASPSSLTSPNQTVPSQPSTSPACLSPYGAPRSQRHRQSPSRQRTTSSSKKKTTTSSSSSPSPSQSKKSIGSAAQQRSPKPLYTWESSCSPPSRYPSTSRGTALSAISTPHHGSFASTSSPGFYASSAPGGVGGSDGGEATHIDVRIIFTPAEFRALNNRRRSNMANDRHRRRFKGVAKEGRDDGGRFFINSKTPYVDPKSVLDGLYRSGS